jgi:ribosomal protein L37AE/L43A
MSENGICPSCKKPSSILRWADGYWLCRMCAPSYLGPSCRLFEVDSEVKEMTTAHRRDLEERRLDTKTGKMYYDRGKTSYFYGH